MSTHDSSTDEPRSRRARRLAVAGMFQIDPGDRSATARLGHAADGAAALLDRSLPVRGVALVCGASGAGKTSTLRALARRVRARRGEVVTPSPAGGLAKEAGAVLDLFDGAVEASLRMLCAAGLAEPALWLRPVRRLSEGERSRLAVALCFARARPGATIVIDEFASVLDRVSAMGVCFGARRLVAGSSVRLVAATAHDDVRAWLAPHCLLELDDMTTAPRVVLTGAKGYA